MTWHALGLTFLLALGIYVGLIAYLALYTLGNTHADRARARKRDECASDGCVDCGDGFDKHAEEAIRMVREPE